MAPKKQVPKYNRQMVKRPPPPIFNDDIITFSDLDEESGKESSAHDPKSESDEDSLVTTRESEKTFLSLAKPQPIVTVHVGKAESKQTFYCHKAFLCHYSPFFRNAFNSNFKEGETQTITLEDDDADTFGLFSYWTLYQDLKAGGNPSSTLMLSKLWILADKFLCPKLQNIVITELGIKKRESFVRRCMELILQNTSRDSQLYKFLIDNMAALWKQEGQIERWEGLSSETFFDLLKKILICTNNGTAVAKIDAYYVLEQKDERQ